MKYPPKLRGYNFEPEEVWKARDNGKLLSMRLETSARCNLRCIYCNGETGRKLPGEISFEKMSGAMNEVKALGGRSVVVIGGGEPTVYPRFRELIRSIRRKKMIPVVITNGIKLSKDRCRFLYDEGASVLIKLDSLNEKIQDRMAGVQGAGRAIMAGVENLIGIGFNKIQDGFLCCGASFVVTKLNYAGIFDVWKFCRENNLYPNLEEFIPREKGLKRKDALWLDKKILHRLKERLLEFDRKNFGFNWFVHSPLPPHGCLQMYYSVYISSQGYVRPCADIDVRFFNVKNMRIADIIRTPFFEKVRHVDEHLAGKCGQCESHYICHGCRGMAFCFGISEGLAPFQAISREDPVCCR